MQLRKLTFDLKNIHISTLVPCSKVPAYKAMSAYEASKQKPSTFVYIGSKAFSLGLLKCAQAKCYCIWKKDYGRFATVKESSEKKKENEIFKCLSKDIKGRSERFIEQKE